MRKLHTKTGHLTAYGLACGYVEVAGGARLSMPSPSSGLYEVSWGSAGWEAFRRLSDARRRWRAVQSHTSPGVTPMRSGGLLHFAVYSVTRYGPCGWVATLASEHALDAMRRAHRSADGTGLVGYQQAESFLGAVECATKWEKDQLSLTFPTPE